MNALIASYSLLAIERDKSSPVDLKENHSLETLDGVVNVNRKGTAVLVGHIQEPIETVKAEGSNRSLKIKREKFAKGLIGVSGDDDGYKKLLGQKPEILPESNVMKTRVGEEMTFKILLDANRSNLRSMQPTTALAGRSMTFVYATESLDDGIAYVKVTSPGVWVLRVEKRIETNARDFDLLSLKATLVFSVQ